MTRLTFGLGRLALLACVLVAGIAVAAADALPTGTSSGALVNTMTVDLDTSTSGIQATRTVAPARA